MLTIFKSFNAKTSILDDFSFYDNRQKAMQSRRIKVNSPTLEGITVKIPVYPAFWSTLIDDFLLCGLW